MSESKDTSRIWCLVGFFLLGGALCWTQIKFDSVEQRLVQLEAEIKKLKSTDQLGLSTSHNSTDSKPMVQHELNSVSEVVNMALQELQDGHAMHRGRRSSQSSSSGRVGSSFATELAVALSKALDQICMPTDKLCLPGSKGDPGAPGWPGQPGVKGEQRIHGRHGMTGQPGKQGPKGIVGPVGQKGHKGDVGVEGQTGQRGLKGEQGLKGNKGEVGVEGARGYPGFKGEMGPKGSTGR